MRVFSERRGATLLLAGVICLAHGVFELTFDKKAGVLYLREIVLMAVALGSAWVILQNPRLLRLKILTYVLLYAVAFVGLSTLFAWLWFQQPPFYGVLEERRTLDVLWVFVLVGLMAWLRPNMSMIVKAYLIAGLVLTLYSSLYYFSIIPDNSVPGIFIEQHFYADDDPRNATRYVLSVTLPVVAIPLALACWSELRRPSERLLVLVALAGMLFTVIFINQTRTLMASIAMVCIPVLLQRSSRNGVPIAVLALMLLGTLGGIYLLVSDNEKVRWMLDSMLNGQQVRLNTASIILSELKSSWFWGHGALSVQFNRGFLNIYNDNFWLNDVGKLGLFYRFGFLTLIFFAFYLYVAHFLWRVASTYRSAFMQVAFWAYLLLLINPMANVTTIGAVELGIITGWLINHESDASGSAVSSVARWTGGLRIEPGRHAA